MTAEVVDTLSRLLPWVPEPRVLRRVLDHVEKAGRPVTGGEVADALGIAKSRACESLVRLCAKRMLERWKAPVVGSYRGHHGCRNAAGRTTWRKSVWLYAVARVDNGDRQ